MKLGIVPVAAVAACASFTTALAAEHVWIGGDQSEFGPGSFAEASFWDGGAPVNTGRNPIVITQDCANVSWTSTSVQNFFFGNWTIGGTNSPSVTFTATSTRPANNPAILTMGTDTTHVKILGSNTVVNVEAGAAISFSGLSLEIDPLATLTGAGQLYFNRNIPGRDYGVMPLFLSGAPSLDGDIETDSDLSVTCGGSGGVDQVSVFSLNGHKASAASLTLGNRDNHTDVELNQSGFARVNLGIGGTLDIAGGIVFVSDPDGTTKLGAPLTKDSSFAGKGTISFGGDFTVTAKTPSLWETEGVALVADGTDTQFVEALSGDFGGDNFFRLSQNYMFASLTVKSGSSVRLVDDFDNYRDTTGAEAMYVDTLVVEEGATLDLNGLNVYARTIQIDGTLVENSGEVIQITARDLTSSLILPGTIASQHAKAVGPIVATDVDNDGKLEIIAMTMDEDNDDDDKFYCIDYDNGALSIRNADNWPASTAASGLYVINWIGLVDRGAGEEILFKTGGYQYLFKISADGSYEKLSTNNNLAYGHRPLFGDIDGDGAIELVGAIRNGTTGNGSDKPNVYIRDANTFETKVSFGTPERNGAGILNAIAYGDVDGDGSTDIAFATSSPGSNGVYRLDGTKIESFVSATPFAMSESFNNMKIIDWDGDGESEVFVLDSPQNYLRVFNADGTQRHNFNGLQATNYGFADFDKDGLYEVVYGGKIYETDGSVMATLPGAYTIGTGVSLADFNGDQVPEVLYFIAPNNQSYGRYLNIYDVAAGALLDGCPITLASGETVSGTERAGEEGGYVGAYHHWRGAQPIVADLDNNGTWEIIIGNGEQNGQLVFNPALTVVNYPAKYRLPLTRTALQMAWRTQDRDQLYSCEYPFPVMEGTIFLVK